MYKKIFPLICSCLLLAGIAIQAQPTPQDVTVSARIDADRITVGDRAKLFLEVRHNSALSRVVWPALPDTFNSLELVHKGHIDTLREGEMVTYRQQLQITGFDSGSFTVPALRIPVISGTGTTDTLLSESFQLLVQTVAVDTTKGYKGIKEIIYVQTTWLDYIWWIIGALVLLGLVIAIIIYFRKKKKNEPEPAPPPKPEEPLHLRYLRLLEELEQQQLWQRDRVKEYYVGLTDILRDYIEERFRTPAMELTTDEILDKARTHSEMRLHLFLLEQILRTADLAKFAKAQPLPQEHTAAIEAARRFVTATTPAHSETNRNKA
jgi:hypothetical protein